jgi:integrase
MALYKRGKTYWYEFMFDGTRYRRSTGVKNLRIAEQIEAAFRTQLAKGEVGIETRTKAPTLNAFAQKFIDFVLVRHADKPQTGEFYSKKIKQVLKFDALREKRLDQIDEALIEDYIAWRRQTVSITTTNRELATLRRLLNVAKEWKVIRSVPRVRLLTGERQRDFVLTHEQEKRYLAASPEPLKSIAILLIDTGLRLGEALHLQKSDVHINSNGEGRLGWLTVRSGKSKNAKRSVPITARLANVLSPRLANDAPNWIFPGDSAESPLLATSVAHAHIKVCRPWVVKGKKLARQYNFPADFVLHSLRHTFLTRVGEAGADAFTIMKLAGHSSVTVSQRYVHPTSESVELAFQRLEQFNQKALAKTEEVGPHKIPHKSLHRGRKSLKGL